MTETIRKAIRIEAPVARVFWFLTSPEHFPEVWPSMLEVSHVHREPDGAHRFDWSYKMAGQRFHGHAETVEIEPNKRVVVRSEAGISSIFRWTYETVTGGTHLCVEIEYRVPQQLLESFSRELIHRFNEHEAEALLANVKARLELVQNEGA